MMKDNEDFEMNEENYQDYSDRIKNTFKNFFTGLWEDILSNKNPCKNCVWTFVINTKICKKCSRNQFAIGKIKDRFSFYENN